MIVNGKEIRINRETAKISEMDTAYCKLVEEILNQGVETQNRTGINTISIAGWNYKFNVGKEFPVAETKDVKVKNCTSEIQWIHQVQSNEVKWLQDRENHTWDLWIVDEDGIYRTYEQGSNAIDDPDKMVPVRDLKGNIMTDKYGKPLMAKSLMAIKDENGHKKYATIKTATFFGKEYAGTIGEAYGFINRLYKRPQYVENTIKTNPTDRRMNIVLWQDAHLEKAVLPSCVWSSEYKVTPDGKLHSYVHQRSADVPLGLPFNITQYAIILSMFAKATGLEVGTMSWSIMDAHIYVNQLDGIKKQLQRYKYMCDYVEVIKNNRDEDIEILYNKQADLFNKLHTKAAILLTENINELAMSKRIKALKNIDYELAVAYEEAFEKKVSFEHILTREEPILELASHNSIFEYSTDYVCKKDSYLKENPIGNKEIKLKKYTPTPFISMPIAQ